MPSIPIFDSLTHPMPNGRWLDSSPQIGNSTSQLLTNMASANVNWALAVGMGGGIGGYDERTYASFIRNSSENIFPVAFAEFDSIGRPADVIGYLRQIRNLGYVGIKIHPRISNIDYSNRFLVPLIAEANQQGLLVLLCTYFWSSNKLSCGCCPEQLLSLLCEIPEERIILLHGGGVRLLEVAEIVRLFPNAILDLSFTICKYAGSSIDADIRYLFRTFDRRICVGSDSPEFGLTFLRNRFDHFSEGLDDEKVANIAHLNLMKCIGITP